MIDYSPRLLSGAICVQIFIWNLRAPGVTYSYDQMSQLLIVSSRFCVPNGFFFSIIIILCEIQGT